MGLKETQGSGGPQGPHHTVGSSAIGCPIPGVDDGKLGCCALVGCTGDLGEQLAPAPTEVEQEEGILLFFAGLLNC